MAGMVELFIHVSNRGGSGRLIVLQWHFCSPVFRLYMPSMPAAFMSVHTRNLLYPNGEHFPAERSAVRSRNAPCTILSHIGRLGETWPFCCQGETVPYMRCLAWERGNPYDAAVNPLYSNRDALLPLAMHGRVLDPAARASGHDRRDRARRSACHIHTAKVWMKLLDEYHNTMLHIRRVAWMHA